MIQWTRLAELENFSDIWWVLKSQLILMIDKAIRRRRVVKERSLSFSLQNRRNKGCSSARAVLEQEIHQRDIGKGEGKTSDRSRSNLKLIPII